MCISSLSTPQGRKRNGCADSKRVAQICIFVPPRNDLVKIPLGTDRSFLRGGDRIKDSYTSHPLFYFFIDCLSFRYRTCKPWRAHCFFFYLFFLLPKIDNPTILARIPDEQGAECQLPRNRYHGSRYDYSHHRMKNGTSP